MSMQLSGPLPRSLVVAALTKPRPDARRSRGWMRRRGLRPVPVPETAERGAVCIDSDLDFLQCQSPGCCALRPLTDDDCPVCGRR
jgi:hypothetical protein